jgi:hypothetical protein
MRLRGRLSSAPWAVTALMHVLLTGVLSPGSPLAVACPVDRLRIAARNDWLGSARHAEQHKASARSRRPSREVAMIVAKTRARHGCTARTARARKLRFPPPVCENERRAGQLKTAATTVPKATTGIEPV